MGAMQKFLWVSVIAVSVLLTACAPATKFTSLWKDDAYQGHRSKIMVVIIGGTPAARRLMEDAFVKELKYHETDAIASYTELPDQSMIEMGAIDAKAREAGADTVLITKTVGRNTGQTSTLAYTFDDTYILAETTVYDMKSGNKILIATSDTWINENVSQNSRINSFAKIIVKMLSDQKLIKPAQTVSPTISPMSY